MILVGDVSVVSVGCSPACLLSAMAGSCIYFPFAV